MIMWMLMNYVWIGEFYAAIVAVHEHKLKMICDIC